MLPHYIHVAANEGDLDTIRAYFEDDSDGARDVDDVCEGEEDEGMTLLMICQVCDYDELTLRHVEVARYLLSRGASIDKEKAVTGSRRPSPSLRATATTASSGTCSRSGVRPNESD